MRMRKKATSQQHPDLAHLHGANLESCIKHYARSDTSTSYFDWEKVTRAKMATRSLQTKASSGNGGYRDFSFFPPVHRFELHILKARS